MPADEPRCATCQMSAPPPVPPMTPAEVKQYMEALARREANAQRPGVLYDGETGLTFDGHPIDPKTGKLKGKPRNLSAPSKESLDMMMLTKALQGDRVAQLALDPTGDPEKAKQIALARLKRKIDSYKSFNARYPGYGGFLPWFSVEGPPGSRRMEPLPDWQGRVPALDNGELAWSTLVTARTLREQGYPDLARDYQGQFDLMRQNAVPMFYDNNQKAIRAEAFMLGGDGTPPAMNQYVTNPGNQYYLNDSSEGLAMVHFTDLYGDWSGTPPGSRDALWATPRQNPAVLSTSQGDITVVEGWRFSSHEKWADAMIPTTDDPVAGTLFENGEKARTIYAVDHGDPGLRSSTFVPTNGADPPYIDTLGVPPISGPNTKADPIYTPYAAFPVMMADSSAGTAWLQNMTNAPRMLGPNGLTESTNGAGTAIAPMLTWDNNALPLVASSGGITSDVRAAMKDDGVYDRFRSTVAQDFSKFDSVPIQGTEIPMATPATAFPKGSPGFPGGSP